LGGHTKPEFHHSQSLISSTRTLGLSPRHLYSLLHLSLCLSAHRSFTLGDGSLTLGLLICRGFCLDVCACL
jgi:hypothetical protein